MLGGGFDEGATTGAGGEARAARLPRRDTAGSLIGRALRDEIATLRLLPGAPLAEKELTARFGVSRTPVREALIRLAEEGLVDVRPQSGTFVARIPLGAIPEAVMVRQALEGATAEAAALRADAAGIDRLGAAMGRLEFLAASGDSLSFHEADEEFHEAVAIVAGHPGIWRMVRQAKVQIDRCRRLTLPVLGRMGQVIAEHGTIVRAIAAGDPEAARLAMREHLGAVLPDARVLAGSHPDFFT